MARTTKIVAPKTAGRKPVASVRALKKVANLSPAKSALEEMGIDAMCDELRGGESLTGISRKLGVGIATLLTWLAADNERSARAREARSAAAAMYDEMADQLLENASDAFELAKAKERAHHLRWRASKVNPASYGDKVQIDAKVDTRTLTDEQLLQNLAALGIQTSIKAAPDA